MKPDDDRDLVVTLYLTRDEATRTRQRSAMLAFHEKAAKAYAAYGNERNAQQARAAANRLRTKKGATP